MSDLKIDLSYYDERFIQDSKLIITKKINFIFGKNGTGKTTITETIKNQFSAKYNICIFEGFEGIIRENHGLDAIALGVENAEIQQKVDEIDIEISNIKKEIEKPEDNTENFFTKLEKASENCKKQFDKIDNFCAESAKQIKEQSSPQIAKTNYNKNDFKNEINKAKLLSDNEIKKYKTTIKSEKKDDVIKISFPEIVLSKYLKSTNEVLLSHVSQRQIIAELDDNIDKQNFAKEGMRIHKHENGERCIFCGNEISEKRWQLLGSYFNDEVKKLENRIDAGIIKIDNELDKINKLREINESDFYEKFAEQIKNLNLQIKNIKGGYQIFLGKLKIKLEDKKKDLFKKTDEMVVVAPKDFTEIKIEYEKVLDENNQFSQNLEREQDNAKNTLRYHEVKKMLDNFKYNEECIKLTTLETIKTEIQKALSDKRQEIENKQQEKNNLILETRNEEKIAKKINDLLKNIGISSFSLELIRNGDESQKGQYQIKGHNGKIRTITKLSKGEKNIIALLYFIFALEKVDDNNKPKIIILDDPMTSNDDTMQYLMIGEVQKLYEKDKNGNYKKLGIDDYLILLTHNCHFYLSIRKPTKYFYKNYGNFHLFSNGKLSTIKSIDNSNDDFKTNYEIFWKELVFLYEQNKPDLMLNSCRKICETYSKFNCINDLYGNNITAKKLFDVNSHSIDDLEAEQNGKTRENIRDILDKLFESNNANEHFNAHWEIKE
ncbi:MAG: AAA family ATPase [Campylobacteraceae bacterium]|jgi:wobble nucleotide-excising tRNase|nr:AAA family ATPase [Campylobacteraceae bacterium]